MLDNETVRQEFQKILKECPDIGTAKVLSNWLFRPANVFDPHARKTLKPEIIIALAFLGLMAGISIAFTVLE
jgi:uncharacterized protein YhhL (DUF1145 family)